MVISTLSCPRRQFVIREKVKAQVKRRNCWVLLFALFSYLLNLIWFWIFSTYILHSFPIDDKSNIGHVDVCTQAHDVGSMHKLILLILSIIIIFHDFFQLNISLKDFIYHSMTNGRSQWLSTIVVLKRTLNDLEKMKIKCALVGFFSYFVNIQYLCEHIDVSVQHLRVHSFHSRFPNPQCSMEFRCGTWNVYADLTDKNAAPSLRGTKNTKQKTNNQLFIYPIFFLHYNKKKKIHWNRRKVFLLLWRTIDPGCKFKWPEYIIHTSATPHLHNLHSALYRASYNIPYTLMQAHIHTPINGTIPLNRNVSLFCNFSLLNENIEFHLLKIMWTRLFYRHQIK